MFEFEEPGPGKPREPCGLCELGLWILRMAAIVVLWVVIGFLSKLCAMLFLIGWNFV